MVEKRGRLGRKNGKGFYDYPQNGPKTAVARARRAAAAASSIPTRSTSQELKQRLLGIQALETARCFEEGVLTDVREADVGSILGFGFAPFTGGTLSYIDMMGTKAFVELCRAAGEVATARALRRRSCCSTWPQRATRSTAAFAPAVRAAA